MKTAGGRALSCLGAALLTVVSAHATEKTLPPALADAWQTLSIGFYADAIEEFTATGNSREAQLGRAIAQLNRPPITPSSLGEAQRQLTALAVTDDTFGHAARYFLGRLAQNHPMQPDPVAAAREYERLIATGADDTWCRLALVKFAILRLTALPAPRDLAAALSAVEPLLERTTDPATQHDLHLVIAEARLTHEIYDATTLRHLQGALATTRASDTMRADMLIQIAQVASRLGDLSIAKEHYEKFVQDYPKERRIFTVSSALAHLGGAFPP